MKTASRAVLAVCAAMSMRSASFGQDAAAAPVQPTSPPAAASGAGPANPVKTLATVLAVQGKCDCRGSATEAFSPVKAGMQLGEGAEFRTGIGGAVQIQIGEGQILTVDRLGYVKLAQILNDGNADRTRIGLERGRMSFDVKSTRFKNDIKIQAPDMTLAITGTSGGLEVADGFPTRAFGDVENTGTFTVEYDNGEQATVTEDVETDAQEPQPAAYEQVESSIDTGDSGSREVDESEVVSRSSGGGDAPTLGIPGLASVPSMEQDQQLPDPPTVLPQPFFFINLADGGLFRGAADLSTSLVQSSVDPASRVNSFGGQAILNNTATGKRMLIRSEFVTDQQQTGAAQFYGYDLSVDGTRVNGGRLDLGLFTQTQLDFNVLSGLGTLGNDLYAVGNGEGGSGVFLVDLLARSLTNIISPGLSLSGALAGSNERGTLFVTGSEGIDGNDTSEHAVLFEIDPRTKYLRSAFRGANGDFDAAVAQNDTGRDLSVGTITVTGLAVVDGKVIFSLLHDLQGDGLPAPLLARFDPSAAGTSSDPHLQQITRAPLSIISGLASESFMNPAASIVLANPAGPVDFRGIDMEFGSLAYSLQVARSGLLTNELRRQIVDSAISPEGCTFSPELANIGQHLENHANEVNGIARAVADFRISIGLQHPCAPQPSLMAPGN